MKAPISNLFSKSHAYFRCWGGEEENFQIFNTNSTPTFTFPHIKNKAQWCLYQSEKKNVTYLRDSTPYVFKSFSVETQKQREQERELSQGIKKHTQDFKMYTLIRSLLKVLLIDLIHKEAVQVALKQKPISFSLMFIIIRCAFPYFLLVN